MTMLEYRDRDNVRWLVGHGWCVNLGTGRAMRGDSAELGPRAKRLHRQAEISPHTIEALELGLNAREREVYVRLRGEGKTVLRAGWPDLLVIDGDEVYAVEVKSPIDRVSARQTEIHEALGRAGLRVEVETVADGLGMSDGLVFDGGSDEPAVQAL